MFGTPDDDRVHVEERNGFIYVDRGMHRWVFPTARPLSYREQRTLDQLMQIARVQQGMR